MPATPCGEGRSRRREMTSCNPPQLRPDWRRLVQVYHDNRTREQITEHYVLERDLAAQLRSATAEFRSILYGELYGELFAQLPHHPRFARLQDTSYAEKQIAVLARLVPADACFLEIGAGDCNVSLAMADKCREAVAVDVVEPPATGEQTPRNFSFKLTDGICMPLSSHTVDFAYSHQLMEHLHPEDAARQLREIHRVLRPGGCYFCITPSRLTGPHDISRFFDDEAQGFHLKEYTCQDFVSLFADAGFGRLRTCITRGRHYAGSVPIRLLLVLERLFASLPLSLRRRLSTNRWVRAVLGMAVLAYKPNAAPI